MVNSYDKSAEKCRLTRIYRGLGLKFLKFCSYRLPQPIANIVRLLKLLLLGAKRNVLVRLFSLDFKRVSFLFSLSVSLQPESREKILSFRSCVEKSFNNVCLSIEIHWIRSSASHRPIDYYFPSKMDTPPNFWGGTKWWVETISSIEYRKSWPTNT